MKAPDLPRPPYASRHGVVIVRPRQQMQEQGGRAFSDAELRQWERLAAERPGAIGRFPLSVRANRQLMLRLVLAHPNAMEFVSPELKADEEFMRQAAEEHGFAVLIFAAPALQAESSPLREYVKTLERQREIAESIKRTRKDIRLYIRELRTSDPKISTEALKNRLQQLSPKSETHAWMLMDIREHLRKVVSYRRSQTTVPLAP